MAEVGLAQVALRSAQPRNVNTLEIAAFAWQQTQSGALQSGAKQIAFALVEGRQVEVGTGIGHVTRQPVLYRRVDGEDIELMHLAKFGAQRRGRRHRANLPAGHVVGLAKTRDNEGACGQAGEAGHAQVLPSVVHHVLVDLVADDEDVGRRQQLLQAQHVGLGPDGGGRVMRGVDQDGPGTAGDGGGNQVEVRAETSRRQGNTHDATSGQFDVGRIAVVAGFEHDDLFTAAHHGQDGGQDGLGGAGGDRDLIGGAVAALMQRRDFRRHGLAQQRDTRHRRVLVQALRHGLGDGLHQDRIAGKVGKSLTQIDRALFRRQRRHDGENGGAHRRQFGEQRWGACDRLVRPILGHGVSTHSLHGGRPAPWQSVWARAGRSADARNEEQNCAGRRLS